MDDLKLDVVPADDPVEMDKRRVTLGRKYMHEVKSIPFDREEWRELMELLEYVALNDKAYYHVSQAVILREKLMRRMRTADDEKGKRHWGCS